MIIYRGRPIDLAHAKIDESVVHRLDGSLIAAGHLLYRPDTAWTMLRNSRHREAPTAVIDQANRAALAGADLMVAFWPSQVPSLGLGREIEMATALGKPVILVTDTAAQWSGLDLVRVAIDDLAGLASAIARYVEHPVSPQAVGFWLESPDAAMPFRAHLGDAGYDLATSIDTVVPAGGFVDIETGLRVVLPTGVWGRITGRSSTLRKYGLLVSEGVIDHGYRGPLFVGVRNLTNAAVVLETGTRIAQFIPHRLVAGLVTTRALTEAEFKAAPHDGRGDAGFGSTGTGVPQ